MKTILRENVHQSELYRKLIVSIEVFALHEERLRHNKAVLTDRQCKAVYAAIFALYSDSKTLLDNLKDAR